MLLRRRPSPPGAKQRDCRRQHNPNCVREDVREGTESHPEEERKLPAIETHSEELGLDPLLFDDVVIVRRLHFLSQDDKHREKRKSR